MTIKDIMDRVSILYNDADFERVTKTMYLKFLDDALSQLVLAKPDAHSKTVSVQLAAGTKQAVPSDCLTLIDIFRNKGPAGTTDGSPVWQVNKKDMDYFSNWHAAADVVPTEITEFAFDPKYSTMFWVSPAPATTPNIYVEMAYSYPFTAYGSYVWETALVVVLPCADTYKNPICDYMLYLLYSTDGSSKADRELANAYKDSFYNTMGIELKVDATFAPASGGAPVSTNASAQTSNATGGTR